MLSSPDHDPLEAIRAQARRTAAHLVKSRARDYARRPMQLEILYPGLATAEPQVLVAVATHLLARERDKAQRWFGFGGEIGGINARAALLLGRTWRRTARCKSN